MARIRCAAIDDEPIALSIIRKYCEDYGDIDLKCYDNPLEGCESVVSDPPDIVFLDIDMQPINGLELARRLPQRVCIIFTTAYVNYALEGFNLNAIDYLQKPLLFPRFEIAMNKAKRWLRIDDDSIILNVEHQIVRINIADITHVEAMDNYVKIYRDAQPMVVSLISMKELMEMLPSDRFARIHRSFIVALQKIESIGSRGIIIRGIEKALPIGKTYSKITRDFIKRIKL